MAQPGQFGTTTLLVEQENPANATLGADDDWNAIDEAG
jgi:hypothetical protein